MSSSSAASTPSTASSSNGVPRVGGVRCYWALLAPRYPNPAVPGSKLELVFVHPDPVLGVHLQKQRLSMMGRGVLEFIHPAEREQARTDLGNAIAADDLQGSVTRVRFARLSSIRKILGGSQDELELPYDAAAFVEDDEYLILDIVINWVADGLLLAFFHAIRDKDPVGNNDPKRRHEEWTNWCGTAKMGEDQIESLHSNISSYIAVPPRTPYPPKRVFQLHTSADAPIRPNSLIFTWPPARQPGSNTVNDGTYDAEEYIGLARGVNLDPAQHGGDDSRTTCTTRYGAVHSVTTEGLYRQVSSVFIPYGSLIFAGFQTTREVALPRPQPMFSPQQQHRPQQQMQAPAQPQHQQPHSQAYYHPDQLQPQHQQPSKQHDQQNRSQPQSLQQQQSQPSQHGQHVQQPQHPQQPQHHQQQQQQQQQQPTQHQPMGQPPLPEPMLVPSSSGMTASTSKSSASGIETYGLMTPQQDWSLPPPTEWPRLPPAMSPSSSTYPALGSTPYPTDPSQSYVDQRGYYDQNSYRPQPLQQIDPTAPYPTPAPTAPFTERSPQQSGVQSGRPLIRPPGDVDCCRHCGLRESPEWRRSETGIKDLCNACGLKLARQVAKREGRQKPRKKKDKEK